MKYRREERLASYLGRRMAQAESSRPYDLIVPIPLHKNRLRERGFNQALLLAREIGKAWKTEVDPFLLVKARPTPPQAALKGEERRKNLRGAFEVRRPERIEGKRVLLVDDVCTTGATLEEAFRTILKAGAQEVEALVLARAE
jgi:ComF family protein